MRVISRRALVRFAMRELSAEAPLQFWYRVTRKSVWRNFADVRTTFRATDLVKVAGGTVHVFDIGGNKFRLIAHVSYGKGKVYVLKVMAHKEYDRDSWKSEL
jgi:mRNA interferase HigB